MEEIKKGKMTEEIEEPVTEVKTVPWHSRGFLSPDLPAGKKWLANLGFGASVMLAVFVFELIINLIFKGSSSGIAAQLIAFLPVAVLLIYIFSLDTIEKEPLSILALLFFSEAFIAYFAIDDVAVAAQKLELLIFGNTFAFSMANYLVGVLLVQGLAIYGVLRIVIWNNNEFDFRFDGIVYATVTSLGFAAEEVIYAAINGGTSLYRSLTEIPGPCFDGVLMGIFFGQARYLQAKGEKGKSLLFLFLSFLVPSCERILSDFLRDYIYIPNAVFTVYSLLRTAVLSVLVLRMAQKDEAIG